MPIRHLDLRQAAPDAGQLGQFGIELGQAGELISTRGQAGEPGVLVGAGERRAPRTP